MTHAGGPATSAVFIVGVSRSGTTLMRRILQGSDEVAICSENHYMGHLIASEGVRQQIRRRFGDDRDDPAVRRIVDFIYGAGLEGGTRLRGVSRQWRWTVRHVPKNAFLDRYLASDRSERALFEIVLRTYAEHAGKRIMGEKTPAHVRYVDTLIEWFPDGRVIHMLRDPRAIYVSELRRRMSVATSLPYRLLRHSGPLLAGFVAVQTTVAWFESVNLFRRHRRRYPDRYLGVQFENLVESPASEVDRISRFVGVRTQPEMLDQVVVSQGHRLGETGFDADAAGRWRSELGPIVRAWFRLLLGAQMRRLGYGE
ncbi:MAG: sulfotransferase family protein [Candidatus Limnocylindria bacterium]